MSSAVLAVRENAFKVHRLVWRGMEAQGQARVRIWRNAGGTGQTVDYLQWLADQWEAFKRSHNDWKDFETFLRVNNRQGPQGPVEVAT